MTRHAKNCTAGSVYTYHEKKKDMKMGGYGTQAERLGKDAQRDFDCCCLTLQPSKDPVISPEGYIYDREAVLEFIVTQKIAFAKKKKEYEKRKNKEEARNSALGARETLKTKSTTQAQETLSSFWVPSLTPQAATSSATSVELQPPDSEIRCPISGNVLKAKKLLPVKWTEVPSDGSGKSLIAKKTRYMCAVSHDVLSNSVPCVYLKTSGHVVTEECFEKVIKKDWVDPTNGKKLTEKDVIRVQRGGTGFASTNEKLTAAVQRPVMQS